MVRPSGRQILDFPIGEFGRNAERDGGKSRGDGGCEIDGNLGPPISSSAIIKSFEREGARVGRGSKIHKPKCDTRLGVCSYELTKPRSKSAFGDRVYGSTQ